MTEADKMVMLGTITGEENDHLLSAYLSLAASKVLVRAYPFGADGATVPPQYAMTQVQIAAYLLNKRGAEGQTSHSENGISRGYEDGDVPATLLREIVPMVGTFYKKEDEDASDDDKPVPL